MKVNEVLDELHKTRDRVHELAGECRQRGDLPENTQAESFLTYGAQKLHDAIRLIDESICDLTEALSDIERENLIRWSKDKTDNEESESE